MAQSTLKTRALVALVSLGSLLTLYWMLFSGKTPDAFSAEEINDMLQNKKSEVSVKKVELLDHAIVSPYLDKHTLKSANWDLSGDIIVQNGKHISLTSDAKHQAANMFSKKPLSADSFEMELTFHLHGKATLKADGFAVWFVDRQMPLGDVFGAQNNFKGLAIVVDTFRNGKQGDFPLISAQYSQGYLHYDKHTDGLHTAVASCTSKALLDPASEKTRMRIVHTKNGYLSVDFNYDPDHSTEWHNCFSTTNIQLPPQAYLGLSAETGELFENVDIIESKIFALYSPDGDHYITSIDELETIMEQQAPAEPENSPGKKRTRKSVLRLRNAEKRIKEEARARRLEKYGDAEATFVRRTVRRIVALVKFTVYGALLVLLAWVAWVAVRSRKGRRSRATGLLD